MKILGKSSLSSKLKYMLDAIWVLSIVAIGIWIIAVAMNSNGNGNGIVDNVSFQMAPTAIQFHSINGDAAFFSEGSGKLSIRGQVNHFTLTMMIVEGIVLASLFLFAIWNLRSLFKTFIGGAPFDTANARRLRWIAASILGTCIFSSLFSLLITYLLDQQFSGEGIRLISRGDLNLSAIFAAIVIFVLAEIFRLGTELEDEKAHTV